MQLLTSAVDWGCRENCLQHFLIFYSIYRILSKFLKGSWALQTLSSDNFCQKSKLVGFFCKGPIFFFYSTVSYWSGQVKISYRILWIDEQRRKFYSSPLETMFSFSSCFSRDFQKIWFLLDCFADLGYYVTTNLVLTLGPHCLSSLFFFWSWSFYLQSKYSEPKLELIAPHYFFGAGAGAFSSKKSFEKGARAFGSRVSF